MQQSTATAYGAPKNCAISFSKSAIILKDIPLSPLLFVIAKLGLSAVGIWILYFFRKRFTETIFRILLGLNVVYISVFVYHLWGLLFLLFTTI